MVKIWKEYYTYTAEFLPLSGSSAPGTVGAFEDFAIRIDPDSDFEFVKTSYVDSDDRFRIKYQDDSMGRFLQKGSIDVRTIGGHPTSLLPLTGVSDFIPFIWPRPYLISAATTFTVQAADFSGNDNTIRITFHGSKIRPGEAPWKRNIRAAIPYVYPLNNVGTISVDANATTSVSIPLDIDSHFVVNKIVGTRTGAALVTIKDGARDRQWMDRAVHFDNLVGSGRFPNILPSNRFVQRGAVISVTVQDLSGSANTIEMNFVGTKLYE